MSYHGSGTPGSVPSVFTFSLSLCLGVLLMSTAPSGFASPTTIAGTTMAPRASLGSLTPTVRAAAPYSAPTAPSTVLNGIDVSQYQGQPNWGSVHSGSGIVFSFARAVAYYGTNDPDFGYDMQNGKAAGVYMGAYDFVYPAYESATGDADYFNGVIKPYVAAGYMYPALDLEEDCSASGGSMDAAQITSWVNAWATELQKDLAGDGYPGVIPIIYMNSNYASNCITSSIGNWHLWIADYCGCGSPSTGIFGFWNYWQYTSSGSVSGISGNVDMDYFAGTLSQLQSGYIFGGAPLTATYSMHDATTNANLYCGGSFLTGDTIQFSASASGGSGGYSYAWSFGDGTAGSGGSVSHVYTKTGTIDPTMTVTDSSGASYTTGAGCSFTVNQGLTISTPLSVSPNPVVVGNTTTFRVSASGGTTPYTYSYAGLPTGCSSANANPLPCTPNTVAVYSVTVTVTDAQGRTATSTASLTVRPTPLVVSSFAASPSSLMVNNSTTFLVVPSGGLPPYSFSYSHLPPGCLSSNSASLSCAPNQIGFYTVAVQVNDSYGQTQTATTSIAVTPRPVIITAFTVAPAVVMIGNNTTFSVTFTGGLGPYTYAYAGLPQGCSSQDVRTLNCTPFQSGTFNVTIVVNDSQGRAALASVDLTVQEGLTVSSFVATPSVLRVGQTTSLTVDVASGTAPYNYSYRQLPPGCTSANRPVLSCSPTRAGTFHVIALVKDALDRLGSSVVTLTVIAPITITAFSASPNTITTGEQTILTVATTGGEAPLSYVYTNLPPGCSGSSTASLPCTPTSAGNFTITVTVSDPLGDHSLSTVQLTIEPAYLHSNRGSSPLFSPLSLALVSLAIVAVIALALIVRRRRHRKMTSEETASPPPFHDAPPGEGPPPESGSPPPTGGS